MKSTKQLSVRMIPALESMSKDSEIGDIGLVPAVRAEISYGDVSVSTIAVIDTGADVSCLDESLFKVLRTRRPERTNLIREASGHPSLPIYNFNVKIKGEPEGLNFENVPVTVRDLGRSVFIIGRRGILEWLRVELDFPNAQVKLILSQSWASKYPYLANEFPKFESAIENIEAQRIQEGIMMLAWDMERFLDRLMADDKELRGIMGEVPLSQRNINEKLIYVCQAKKIKDLHKEIEEFVNVRNNAAHARVFESWEKLSTESVLKSAEKIVSRLSPKIIPSLHNQTAPEENFVGREDMLETITRWYNNPDVRIGALIGWGGVGKSALVRKWYESLEDNKIRPDGVFWWGFYRNAHIELFLNALLRYVSGGHIEAEEIKSTWEKVERIKENIGQRAYLIILDGLEEMQKGEVSGEQFGCMEHRECSETLRFLADTKGNGLCLITTRYPLTDIKNYERKGYQKKEIERLSTEDARGLFEKVGVKGSREEIESVIEEYDGHALSLTLLSKYLVEDFSGDITRAKEIPAFHSDEEAGGKAHRILLWYAEQLTEEQSAFMKIFSLFRRAVREEDFEGVLRAKMETEMNQALAAMSVFTFKRMVDNLVDRRLISKDQDNTYATHPLIKNYFESIFDEDDKKLCHKRIYEYIGEYAPERADTLEEMQPLFEQVYHGCAAGLYDETLDRIFYAKIDRSGRHFLYHELGAWETELSLVRTFFPKGNLSKVPLVSEKNAQSFLLNEAGLALLCTGRPKEAEGIYKRKLEINIRESQWELASVGYQNLAGLQFRTGELESGFESTKSALDLAEKAESDEEICDSKAYLGWVLYLLGKTKDAEKEFRQADELSIKIEGNRLRTFAGTNYADFLISMERIDEAFELTKQNLEICQRNNWTNHISSCHRCLGAIERTKGNYKEAENHFQEALEIARKVGYPAIEIEALLESGRLRLDMERYEDAIGDADNVLKICERTGFRFYEPGAEMVLAKAYLGLKDFEKAEANANSAYEKAVGMRYRWAEGDAADLLGEIYSVRGEKAKGRKWIKKAVGCRKEILDPKVKETEGKLAGSGRGPD